MAAMQDFAWRLRPIWPFVTLLASGALLAAAHAFERFGGLAPCALCLDQREFHWGIVALSVGGIIGTRFAPGSAGMCAGLIAIAYAASTWMAGYHVAVEQHWITAQCEAPISGNLTFDVNADFAAPSCDTPAWTLFGISMAGFNALISFALMVASFVIAFTPRPRSANG